MNIPKDKEWRGTYPGNYQGNLWQTFNIDLERFPDRLALSDKMRILASGLGTVSKFVRTNATTTDQWFGIINGTDIIRNGNSLIIAGTWVTDDTTGTFNDPLDMVVHELANGEQRLLCTRDTNIAILNSSGAANVWDDDWWTAVAGGPTLTSLSYHPMARLQRLVAVGDKQSGVPVIHTLDKDDVVSNSRLSFPADYTVRNIYTTSNRFWIGLQHDYGGRAKVIEWDGFSLTYNNEYELMGSKPMCGFVVDDIPYFITERGFIHRYNGGGFEVVQDFGIREQRVYFGNGDIGNYGAAVDGKKVYLNIGMPTLQSFAQTVLNTGVRRGRAGIWVFNTENLNLYHHMGMGEHASAGTDVNYGTSPFAATGAVVKYSESDVIVASASVYTGGATWLTGSQSGIYRSIPNREQASNAGRNRGYFITPYIPIEDAEAMFQALKIKFKKFVSSSNSIVVKWRVTEPLFNSSATDPSSNALELMNAEGDWLSTTTFSAKVPVGVSVGDEVEILTGDNAGCSFKVSALSATPDNTTAITVTIAEAAPTSSTDTFLCRFDNWTTETAITDTTLGQKNVPFSATAHGQFIQFKIELRGFDVQVDELIPVLKLLTTKKQA